LFITPALMPAPTPAVPPTANEPAPSVIRLSADASTFTDCNALGVVPVSVLILAPL